MSDKNRYIIKSRPEANPDAVVSGGRARFTVLTPELVRIEYSSSMEFEDRASQVFWFREQPVPKFEVIRSEDKLEIITEYLHIHYVDDGLEFNEHNLFIDLLTLGKTYYFGQEDRGNLLGTKRTLDAADGAVELEKGLLSRDGSVLFDDSNSLVINSEGWVEERKEGKDYYFFGYGSNFIKCIQDFTRIAGSTSLIPKWALGNWWSRYWEYSDRDLMDLMTEFKDREIPLSVCIVDMDWHVVQNKYTNGWTGYTWNRSFFPEPEKFIEWLHENGLKTGLNLHPALGVHPHEEGYEELAKHMGIDPASEKPIEFDIVNQKFVEGYLDILHHPIEEQGVDFWWLDWQQGTESKIKKLDPLFWLNHVHFYDLMRDGKNRPFTFSRYGGPGSHRYPIGFSGDTIVSWKSLAFQPYFTATASNVAYGWWSHDIGGHFLGTEDSELNLRWIQFGIFSPIFRIHSGKNIFQDRRPWANDAEVYKIVRNAMAFRHSMIPYIYTMAHRNHVQGIPLITPMYYEHADNEKAYDFKDQYYFGTELLVSPYISKRDADSNLSRKTTWLPEGEWFNFFTGEYYKGEKVIAAYGKLEDIPVYAKAGAIIPLNANAMENLKENPSEMDVIVFPGKENSFSLYEDDGETMEYAMGKYAVTKFSQRCWDSSMEFIISSVEGVSECIPAKRNYNVKVRGTKMPVSVEVYANGRAEEVSYVYHKGLSCIEFAGITVTPSDEIRIRIIFKKDEMINKNTDVMEKCTDLLKIFTMENGLKGTIYYHLPEILKDMSKLFVFQKEMQYSQWLALTETIKGQEILSSLK